MTLYIFVDYLCPNIGSIELDLMAQAVRRPSVRFIYKRQRANCVRFTCATFKGELFLNPCSTNEYIYSCMLNIWNYLNSILISFVNLTSLKYSFKFFLFITSIILVSGNMKCILVFCLVVALTATVHANSCTDACDATFTGCVQGCRDAHAHGHHFDACESACQLAKDTCHATCHGHGK